MREHIIGLGLFAFRVLVVTIVGVALLIGLVFGFNNPTINRIIPEIIWLIVAAVMSAVAIYQVLVHETELACMSGMMIGMTTGMLTGFLFGYLVGATTGMFVGSVVGVAVGSALGAAAGRCCGIMGIMEGLMAGLMSGTMGAMIAVMLMSDHYRAFTWLFVGFCLFLFGALSIMVEREFKQMGRPPTLKLIRAHERTVMLSTVLFVVLIILIMVWAPRGPITVFSLTSI